MASWAGVRTAAAVLPSAKRAVTGEALDCKADVGTSKAFPGSLAQGNDPLPLRASCQVIESTAPAGLRIRTRDQYAFAPVATESAGGPSETSGCPAHGGTVDAWTHFGPLGLELAWTANRRHGAAIAPKIPSQRERQAAIRSIAVACPRWSSHSHSR